MRRLALGVAAALLLATSTVAHAQSRVGTDSITRLERFGRSLVYGASMGLVFSGYDQLRKDPSAWGNGWSGYGKRVASNVGEFVIQEGVTEGLAALGNRPVDYRKCHCGSTSKRVGWALKGAFTDQMPNGQSPIAYPRIIGAYAGSFSQAAWRPSGGSRASIGLVNGTVSLAIGGLINLFHEFK